MKVRVISTGRGIYNGETLFKVYVRGWIFWHQAGYAWGRTPEEALQQATAELSDQANREVQALENIYDQDD